MKKNREDEYLGGWIDAHSHLSLQQVEEARGSGIVGWVLGGIEPMEWQRQLVMKVERPSQIYPVFGLHPWWIHTATREMFWQAFEQLKATLSKAYALGETGLDLFRERRVSLPLQLEAFRCQVELAQKIQKPLVLHIVQAHDEAQLILKNEGVGIVHSFSGSLEDAQYYSGRGFLISVSGSILKRGYKGLKQAVAALPLGKIVIETDSGSPWDLLKIAQAVANLKQVTKEEVLQMSTENVKRVFNL